MMRTKAVLEQFIYIRVKILHSFWDLKQSKVWQGWFCNNSMFCSCERIVDKIREKMKRQEYPRIFVFHATPQVSWVSCRRQIVCTQQSDCDKTKRSIPSFSTLLMIHPLFQCILSCEIPSWGHIFVSRTKDTLHNCQWPNKSLFSISSRMNVSLFDSSDKLDRYGQNFNFLPPLPENLFVNQVQQRKAKLTMKFNWTESLSLSLSLSEYAAHVLK
jgi:hypothetical protein